MLTFMMINMNLFELVLWRLYRHFWIYYSRGVYQSIESGDKIILASVSAGMNINTVVY
jgi:hypothetical protein